MSTAERTTEPTNSHIAAKRRFGTAAAAARYPAEFRPRGRDRREQRSLETALAPVPAGARVLDLPCGTGRLLRMLVARGYRVTAADVSIPMLVRAEQNWRDWSRTASWPGIAEQFVAADVMRLPWAAARFDAVVCNRLLHHLTESRLRRAALAELRRVSRGPIVASFFHSFALDALRRRAGHWWRKTTPVDRVPISLATLRDDCQAAGLTVTRLIPTRWGISPQWYAVMHKAD